MAENTEISWAHHSFSTHWGCREISPACFRCYARTLAKRWGFDVWGEGKPRRFFSDEHWRQPLKWDARAGREGVRERVFVDSMSDFFENRSDLDDVRARLFRLAEVCRNLDFLLLTKRANCILRMLPLSWCERPRPNVWIGVTAENQRRLEERVPELLAVPAVVRWVSAEPLLGPVDFSRYLTGSDRLDWVVVGGESGHGARRMDPAWARGIMAQCRAAGVAVHFKQKGTALAREMGCVDRDGKDPAEFPAEFMMQEFPKGVA